MIKILLVKTQALIGIYNNMLRQCSVSRILAVGPLILCCLHIFLAIFPCLTEAAQFALIEERLKPNHGVFISNKVFSIDYLENKFPVSDTFFNVLSQIEKDFGKFGTEGSSGFVEVSNFDCFKSMFVILLNQFFREIICNGTSEKSTNDCSTYANNSSKHSIRHLLFGAFIGYCLVAVIIYVPFCLYLYLHTTPCSGVRALSLL